MRDKAHDKESGNWLEITRRAPGYAKQTDFAQAIGEIIPISVQRWNAYECGRGGLPWRMALALCDRFDLSMDWIYRGKRGELLHRVVKAIEAVETSRR